jgi:geranylgeranyl pyrophosphate synthase
MEEVEIRMRMGSGQHNPALDQAIEHLLSSGGKRIRPTVVLLSAAMLGADPHRAVTLAAAIEMLHTATLVHDDLIDGALLRRGSPTLNARWTPGATVLTGDYVFARAAYLAALTGSLPVMQSFARTLMTIVNGEINQLFHTQTGDLRRDYLDRIYSKTASLFELATEGAALLAESDATTLDNLRIIGYQIGVAFQIVDDVLDFVGNEDEVGKPVASDLRQGIITLPCLCYLEANPDDINVVNAVAGRRLDDQSLERLILDIRSSEAVAQSLEEARSFLTSGETALLRLPDTPERAALRELAHYVVERTM